MCDNAVDNTLNVIEITRENDCLRPLTTRRNLCGYRVCDCTDSNVIAERKEEQQATSGK